MKRSVAKVTLITAALGAMAVGTAFATPYLEINGGAPIALSGVGNEYSIPLQTVDGWTIQGSLIDYSPLVNPDFDLGATPITVTCAGAAGCSQLTLAVSDTGFTTPVGVNGFEMDLGNTTKGGTGSVVETGNFDTHDTLFGTDGTIGTITCNEGVNLCDPASGVLMGGGPAGGANIGPYSLTLTDVFNASTEMVTFSTDGSISVPEPGTLALFGAALLGCALFLGRRRSPNV